MDKAPYEFDAIFLNRLSYIVYTMTAVTDITFFGHYFLHSNIFVEKICEIMDLIKGFSLLNYR